MDGRVLPGEFGRIEEDGIVVMGIIGEIEGHNSLPGDCKTTSYEHILPMLCHIEKDCGVKGVLFVINTVGGDVSCGLAIAEMIAGLSKPTVSLWLATVTQLVSRLRSRQSIHILRIPQQL